MVSRCTTTMGVHRLNQFLRKHGGDEVRRARLGEFVNKVLAVDASIYMYRFLGERCLLAGIYQMVVLFRRHGVELVFVFDGAPPLAKHASQEERRQRRELARCARHELEAKIASNEVLASREVHAELSELRRKSVRLGRARVAQVQELLRLCGVAQIAATGEADHVCAALVASGECWGCLSEDTDMFPLGCARVLRHLNLQKGTCVLYDWEKLRARLDIPQEEFQVLCAAAGSDYGAGVDGLDMMGAWSRWKAWAAAGRHVPIEQAIGNSSCNALLLDALHELQADVQLPQLMERSEPNMSGVRDFLRQFGFVFVS